MGPEIKLASGTKEAEDLKNEGNRFFSKNRLSAAIDAYTGAISLCPNIPVYYTNRALCHKKLNNWKPAESDCQKAILLDRNSVKAHYLLGLALSQMGKFSEAAMELKQALDLWRVSSQGDMIEEIWRELANAKYFEWERLSTKRLSELQNLKESCETALKERHFLNNTSTKGFVVETDQLQQVFGKAAEDDTPTEVPDYLCCKISLEIFRDPVITPSGVTYERAEILKHLQKGRHFDPVTREVLYPSQLVPNLAIRGAVEAYLEKHGWAYRS